MKLFKKTKHSSGEKSWRIGSSTIKTGRFTYGIQNLNIQEWGEGSDLIIGSFCSIANSVNIILGGNHRTDWITTFPFGHIFKDELGGEEIKGHPTSKGDIIIGHDVWLGQGCTILSGVKIGNGAVIGSNTIVTKDIPAYAIAVGNPSKISKFRFDAEIIKLLEDFSWWNLPIASIREIAPKLSQTPDYGDIVRMKALYSSKT